MLVKIVDDDEGVSAFVAAVFGDGEAGERRDPLQRGRRSGGGDDEDAALRAPIASTDSTTRSTAVDRWPTGHRPRSCRQRFWLMIVSTAIAVLPVARSPMISSPLAAAQRKQGVDHQHAGRHRLFDQRAIDDRRRGRSIG